MRDQMNRKRPCKASSPSVSPTSPSRKRKRSFSSSITRTGETTTTTSSSSSHPSLSGNDDAAHHIRKQPQTNNSLLENVIQLNAKQAQALQAIKDKKNIFLTGVAGTGKSVVLKEVLKYCSQTFQSCEWVAVAPTGVTAIAIGGQTIHSFAGIGIPYEQEDFQKSWQREKRMAWRQLKIMVIEEISMIAGEFLDRLDTVVRQIRGVDAPFGGIQLMICGDFLQLPPIPESPAKMREMRKWVKDPGNIHGNRGFAFQSYFWKEANLETIHLTEVFRQSNPQFVNILNRIRRGFVDEKATSFLRSCARPLTLPNKDIEPTRLYSKNVDVNRENMSELARLDGEIHHYKAVDHVIPEEEDESRFLDAGTAEEILWESDFFRQTVAEDLLRLKVGAQVMLIKNDTLHPGTLVNGSRGVVVGFTNEEPQAPFDMPITTPLSDSHRAEKEGIYPQVKFQNGETRILGRAEFTSRIVGVGRCVRLAVPLKLAWAITVHKSQGMTLDYVKIDLHGVFCEGQAYVALSRAKDEKCLELRNFSRRAVKVNPRALAFYNDKPKYHHDEIPNWDHGAKWTRSKVKVKGTKTKGNKEEENRYDAIPEGTIVSLKGLVSRPELNGDRGTVQQYDATSGRYIVVLEDWEESMKVKPSNLLQHVHVKLHGLKSKPEWNGENATIIAWDATKERYNVDVMGVSKKAMSVKPTNVILDNGTVGMVTGLQSKPELNGKFGTIKSFNSESGRYDVQLSKTQVLRLKLENIHV